MLQDYEYIGMGWCLDSEGNIYDRYHASLNSFDECAALCTKNVGFRGITVEDGSNLNWSLQRGSLVCHCYYDKGLLYGGWDNPGTLFPVPDEYQGGRPPHQEGQGSLYLQMSRESGYAIDTLDMFRHFQQSHHEFLADLSYHDLLRRILF